MARAMVAAKRRGQFVVVASGAANAPLWGWSHYSASKAAVAMLARAMVLKLRQSPFDPAIRAFTIGADGIVVGEPMAATGLLTGSAVPVVGPAGPPAPRWSWRHWRPARPVPAVSTRTVPEGPG